MGSVIRGIGVAAVVAALATGAMGRASASTVAPGTPEVFTASGTFDDGATLGGTMTIDTTYGDITATSLWIDSSSLGLLTFDSTNPPTQGPGPADYYLIVSNSSGSESLVLYLSTTTLVGYDGGPLGSADNPAGGMYISNYGSPDPNLTSGSLAPALVPEPSSMVLAGIATATGLGLVARRRRRA